jgi:hypothetical protein
MVRVVPESFARSLEADLDVALNEVARLTGLTVFNEREENK